MSARFTVDLEWDYQAVTLPETWVDWVDDDCVSVAHRLLRMLHRHNQQATFYVSGYIARCHPGLIRDIHLEGHSIGNHGYWHRQGEQEGDSSYHMAADAIFRALNTKVSGPYPYRSPFWSTTPRPGWSGGAFFRVLPYAWLKWEIERSGVFWIHPHDLMNAPIGPWRRQVRFCRPWERLERLLTDVDWRTD